MNDLEAGGIIATWVKEDGVKCISIDGMIEKLTSLTELDYEMLSKSLEIDNIDFKSLKLASLELALNIMKCIYKVDDSLNYKVYRNYENYSDDNSRAFGFVYIAHTKNTNQYKIGSTGNIEKRLKTFKTGNPHITIIATKQSYNRLADERIMHKLFKKNKISGEWFALSSEQLIEAIDVYGFNYCIEGGNI